MNQIDFIADLLTEDPDLILEGKSRVVIAVHPNYVIDAVAQAASKFADDTSYRDYRAAMMLNYNRVFKDFMNSRLTSTIIITRLKRPPSAVKNWYTSSDEISDPTQLNQEKIVAMDAYQDLEDYLAELRTYDNVVFYDEEQTGDSCQHFSNLLRQADFIEVVGGNLSGCLAGMLDKMRAYARTEIRVVEAVTFDDDVAFWRRMSREQ